MIQEKEKRKKRSFLLKKMKKDKKPPRAGQKILFLNFNFEEDVFIFEINLSYFLSLNIITLISIQSVLLTDQGSSFISNLILSVL